MIQFVVLAVRAGVAFYNQIRSSRIMQISMVACFWLAGDVASRLAGLTIPGAIVGLGLLLCALCMRWFPLSDLKRGADWLLAEMLLFFVPAVLAIIDHHEFFGILGLKILSVVAVGTISVMGATALTVDLLYRWGNRNERVTSLD